MHSRTAWEFAQFPDTLKEGGGPRFRIAGTADGRMSKATAVLEDPPAGG